MKSGCHPRVRDNTISGHVRPIVIRGSVSKLKIRGNVFKRLKNQVAPARSHRVKGLHKAHCIGSRPLEDPLAFVKPIVGESHGPDAVEHHFATKELTVIELIAVQVDALIAEFSLLEFHAGALALDVNVKHSQFSASGSGALSGWRAALLRGAP